MLRLRRLLPAALLVLVAGCDLIDSATDATKQDVTRVDETLVFRAELEISRLTPELEFHYARHGAWPEDWRAIRRSGLDPWGNAYLFTTSGPNATVYSPGPDGQPDTPDDVYGVYGAR